MTPVLNPEFVEFIPEKLEDGKIYVSEEYKTAVHKCACGCGNKVVTPLSPTGWRMTKEVGGAISLYPSIGNWSFPCRSHYWVRRNRVIESYDMPQEEVEARRHHDARLKQRHFEKQRESGDLPAISEGQTPSSQQRESALQRFIKWLFG
jgi:hypothetical protein